MCEKEINIQRDEKRERERERERERVRQRESHREGARVREIVRERTLPPKKKKGTKGTPPPALERGRAIEIFKFNIFLNQKEKLF